MPRSQISLKLLIKIINTLNGTNKINPLSAKDVEKLSEALYIQVQHQDTSPGRIIKFVNDIINPPKTVINTHCILAEEEDQSPEKKLPESVNEVLLKTLEHFKLIDSTLSSEHTPEEEAPDITSATNLSGFIEITECLRLRETPYLGSGK